MPSRPATLFKVYVDGAYTPELKVQMIQRSCGGQMLDSAVLVNDPRFGSPPYLQNLRITDGKSATIVIISEPLGNPAAGKAIFWGRVTREQVQIQDGNAGERLVVTARVEDFHFGEPLRGKWTWDTIAEDYLQIDCQQIIFNPIHEGKVHFNRWIDKTRNQDEPIFIEVEYLEPAETEQNEESLGQEWSLADAVYYCCGVCNGTEPYIANPTLAELRALFSPFDFVRHLTLKNGLYLPKILDALLEPFGYQWCVQIDPNNARRKIGMWRRGVGLGLQPVTLQAPVAPVNPGTNLKSCDIQFDVSAAYNSVLGLGGFIEIESTWELLKAWPESQDDLKDTPDVLNTMHANYDDHPDAWRKFVLNEGGDYNELRGGSEYDKEHNFTSLTADADDFVGRSIFCTKRRKFRPTLTIGEDGSPIGKVQGVVVEYFNGNTGATNGWTVYPGEVQILSKECGIRFSGQRAPEEILRQGTNVKVRVTATVRFDARLPGLAARQPGSPLADDQQLILDLHDRFHWRFVGDDSQYKSQVDSGELLANEADDREAIAAYAEDIRLAWDQASINGPLVIEGCDWTFRIGAAVSGIDGRNISFRSRADNARYPTIAGITYNVQAQTMELQLDQYRKARMLRLSQDRQGIEGTS